MMVEKDRLRQFQDRIDYSFRDLSLLEVALRHSSFAYEAGLPYEACNERMEFLGDAVLELLASHALYLGLPETHEGQLTKTRASLVCESSLAEAARGIDLGDLLSLGVGEEKTGGRDKPSILSDAMEAVIGAVYLDGGLLAAEKLVRRFVVTDLTTPVASADSKSALQEKLQQKDAPAIRYETEPDAEGFTSRVYIGDKELGCGQGRSKKLAEQAAAAQALAKDLSKYGTDLPKSGE